MKEDKIYNTALFYRLVALWVVCEAFAGGLMHAAKIPFTGMIVSSLAVTCIILIAYYIPSKSAVLKATIIVAFFKLMLSPHSPPTAYIAVFFQGYLGYILFNHRKHFLLSSVLLAVFALVESALQRILVLLVIYGNGLWEAVDIYLQKTVGGTFNNYSATAAGMYILIHMLAGLFVGTTMARLVTKSENKNNISAYLISTPEIESSKLVETKTKKRKLKGWFILIWLFIFGLYLQAIHDPAQAVLPANKIFMIFVRSVLIISTWYLILSPLSMAFLRRFIKDQNQSRYRQIEEIQQIIPDIQRTFFSSWQLSGANRGLARVKVFIRILLINIVHTNSNVESKP